LSVAFDLPTQIGYDSDHPLAAGEVGRVGVAIDSIEDMLALFDGIPARVVSTSMTINATAIILLALYVAVGKRQGVEPRVSTGTLRTTSSRITRPAAPTSIPPAPSLRIVTDIIAFCESEVPQWNSISISGYPHP
jgi:methylmalonyl-CoA mutase N-terminal domain/subunit